LTESPRALQLWRGVFVYGEMLDKTDSILRALASRLVLQ
jgi:hypothetical protein